MSVQQFVYEFSEKRFYQVKLPVYRLLKVVERMDQRTLQVEEGQNVGDVLLKYVSDNFHDFVGLVLVPHDWSEADMFKVFETPEKLEAHEHFVRIHITPEVLAQAVMDFFDCNPVDLLRAKVVGALGAIAKNLFSTQDDSESTLNGHAPLSEEEVPVAAEMS